MIPFTLRKRLSDEIYGLLTDIGMAAQRTDSFVDQEKLVNGFISDWSREADKIEQAVLKQIENGKVEVSL
ncbi:MAG: hypothetical protein AVO39_10195 [delta proteobacterium MLS_D]|nr:MAG: hypothetical protein AVO39_10195 [delta proteobacterium MLS_D]